VLWIVQVAFRPNGGRVGDVAKRQRPEVSSQRSEARVSWQKSVVGDHASEPRVSRFQKMDCAAPASFTHTHATCAACTPPPAKRGNWRRAKRTRESSFFSPRAPPPPANENWRRGSNSSRNMHILAIWRRQLAEGGSGAPGILTKRCPTPLHPASCLKFIP